MSHSCPTRRFSVFDMAVFQGASYFRSLGRGNLYRISARGLSIGTGGPQEEFPLFRTFWLEKPKPGAEAVQVHALLDSQSVTGAYHMTINPGATTVIDEIGRAHVCTPVTNAHLVCRLLLAKKNSNIKQLHTMQTTIQKTSTKK